MCIEPLENIECYQEFFSLFREVDTISVSSGETEYNIGNLSEDFHNGYSEPIRRYTRNLKVNGISEGNFVILDQWQISFNPTGRKGPYGYIQVVLYAPNENPRNYWQAHGTNFHLNLINQFKLGQEINVVARYRWANMLVPEGFSAAQNRIISPSFTLDIEGVSLCLYYLFRATTIKWQLQNELGPG